MIPDFLIAFTKEGMERDTKTFNHLDINKVLKGKRTIQ